MTACHIPSCPNSGRQRTYGWINGVYLALHMCDRHREEWERTRCTCPAGWHRPTCPVMLGTAEEEGR